MKTLFILFLSTFTSIIFAQQDPVKWEVEAVKKDKSSYHLIFTATVESGWYVYSQYLESEDGPVATSLNFDKNDAIDLQGKATEEGDKIEGFDKLFEMNISKFKKKLQITQLVNAKKGTAIKGYLTYMSCNDEMCLPPQDFEFDLQLK